MDAAQSLHPTDQTLVAYGLGKLDDRSADAVNEHLMECSACRNRVAEMPADSFLQRVRDAQKPSDMGGTQSGQSPNAPSPPAEETLLPELVNHPDYEIRRELGRGGMGVVYLAHNTLMDRDEVLKVMGQHLLDRPGVIERFLREIRAVAKLRHPNIVTAHHAARLGGSIVFAMEYVEGLDLCKLVKTKGPLPIAHACYFIYQAALGLQHAHEQGLVHRDIKPGNLMFSRKGDKVTIKILDFGLAKAAREEKVAGGLTSKGEALGTPDYIAPEQIVNAPTADIRADIYSLGGTLYYLLTGRPPFQEKSLYDLYQAHISRIADPLDRLRPDVPAELATLVAKMMAKNPSERFQTPGEVSQALTPFFKKVNAAPKIQNADNPEASPVEAEPHVAPWRRPLWVWPAVAVGVLMLGLFAAWLGGMLRVKTPEGDLIFSDLPEQSVVTVDGKVYTVEWPGDTGPAKITVPAGDHRVKVELNGVQVHGEEVSIETGKQRWITVRLESHLASRLVKEEAPTASTKLPRAPVSPSPTVASPQPPMSGRDGGDWIITNSIGMKLALIPAGSFEMGSTDPDKDAHADERPRHTVRITRPFYLGVYEVTQEDYKAVMGRNPSWLSATGLEKAKVAGQDTRRHPVENVSWNDAIAFCNRLSEREGLEQYYPIGGGTPLGGNSYRLPTEAEWEYACRAGSTTRYSFGEDAASLGEYGWYRGNSDGKTHPVGQKRSNAWGLYDMHGNVFEWCWDLFDSNYYGQSPGADPVGSSQGGSRVYRGGAHGDFPQYLRAANRSGTRKYSHGVGFRVARDQSDLSRTVAPAATASERPKPEATVRPEPPKTITNTIGMKLVLIPAGEFLMGSPDSDQGAFDDEKPQHRVRITRPFYLGATEVTQGQYRAVTGADPSYFKGSDDLPVEQVSWEEARAFCDKLNAREKWQLGGASYRLPTEAEWEYACRAATTRRFSFGEADASLGEYTWFTGNSEKKTHAVGQKRPNAWGLFDMHGNVWEWCWDDYDEKYYAHSPGADPLAASQAAARVNRGGSWRALPRDCRAADRNGVAPDFRNDRLGFRLARVQSSR